MSFLVIKSWSLARTFIICYQQVFSNRLILQPSVVLAKTTTKTRNLFLFYFEASLIFSKFGAFLISSFSILKMSNLEFVFRQKRSRLRRLELDCSDVFKLEAVTLLLSSVFSSCRDGLGFGLSQVAPELKLYLDFKFPQPNPGSLDIILNLSQALGILLKSLKIYLKFFQAFNEALELSQTKPRLYSLFRAIITPRPGPLSLSPDQSSSTSLVACDVALLAHWNVNGVSKMHSLDSAWRLAGDRKWTQTPYPYILLPIIWSCLVARLIMVFVLLLRSSVSCCNTWKAVGTFLREVVEVDVWADRYQYDLANGSPYFTKVQL